MNYAKVLNYAMGLFPKKIKVTLKDPVTKEVIGKYKIPAELLPPQFNKPTTIEVGGYQWRVLEARPVSADDYLIFKKLTLHVQKEDQRVAPERFDIVTICSQLPDMMSMEGYATPTLESSANMWRQIEFLPLNLLPEVKEDINAIDTLLKNQSNPLLGYETQHKREKTVFHYLDISFDEFCSLIGTSSAGNVSLHPSAHVANGFSLYSQNYIYYGTLLDNKINTLCLHQFEAADDELFEVLTKFQLILVDWLNCRILSSEESQDIPTGQMNNIAPLWTDQ